MIRSAITMTTAADGSATGYIPEDGRRSITGRVVSLGYTRTDYLTTVDITITSENADESIWTEANVTATKRIVPMQAAHTTAGVAVLYAAGNPIYEPVHLVKDRIKIVLAQGGDTKVGAFAVVIAEKE